ncbi:sigma-70 family RNA polymerase sigma factor [Geodermatophilus obscurus]|uniref:RNA polymerase, sigma-24 subunit, ECF subfamily n=1 Tax=Geodermatophilus obscurus (strain ATCC 25078 / DSM 43160 / JCM 3152 / CCUG 61914 / KCC A-0152 / KCTC 9177 / NBRC 13315 / NRRL B-3577 / G-20) TaxID=526225 RepID=D2S4G2_GEOOG|nr:sigma-70 family RNA polymerase sigma factor [Geodermatophilus obscurus]ADB75152.1 RNA polymerase, sigma-24 subunit, ECF subfamily [Geodermatophilus obscurus DSM 43160]
MSGNDVLAAQFEEHRHRLTAVASRLLGSRAEAEDAVQEAWLRVSRAGSDEVADLGGWLTTVVARVALNQLRARANRREDPYDDALPARLHANADPAQEAVLTDSVGLALLVVLDQLAPAERLAFVLHDLFDVPFDEIAPIVDRSPAAARQLASRARRRVRGAELPDATERRREVVAAFLDASRDGDFSALLELLHPEAVLRSDAVAARMGAAAEVRGAAGVARFLSGRARAARLVLVDGVPGAVWSLRGTPQVVFAFTVEDGVVTAIDLLAAPGTLSGLDLHPLRQR